MKETLQLLALLVLANIIGNYATSAITWLVIIWRF
jgi:hypothetical protein